jgi:hypothetical protein
MAIVGWLLSAAKGPDTTMRLARGVGLGNSRTNEELKPSGPASGLLTTDRFKAVWSEGGMVQGGWAEAA